MKTSLDELSNDYDGNRNQNFEDADDLSDKHKSLAHYINATTVVSHRVIRQRDGCRCPGVNGKLP